MTYELFEHLCELSTSFDHFLDLLKQHGFTVKDVDDLIENIVR